MDEGRRKSIVNYEELSDNEDEYTYEENVYQVEDPVTDGEESNSAQLNARKQYTRAVKNSRERADYEIDLKRNLPKGSGVSKSYYIYINLHPGIFQLITSILAKYLHSEFNMKLKSGKPDKFGKATTKNITNFSFEGDEKPFELQLTLYPTKSSIDVRLKGNPKDVSRLFKDKGFMTGAAFFASKVLPKLVEYLYQHFDVPEIKLYWSNLAQQGLNHEFKKLVKNPKFQAKCSHCKKKVGKKPTLQCKRCDKHVLEECVNHIEENRLERIREGDD